MCVIERERLIMGFTEEQLKAIESRGENLLVSAAAGSGKTTVLVERIIRRILDEKDPVDIDRMLVMTFTRAAAEQMKVRILEAIDEKRAKDPGNRHLIRQSALLHNAKISTIHGFCMDVIRDHFAEIDLDPDFRIGDEAECLLMKQDVLTKVIEKAYEEGSGEFLYMSECLSSGKSDRLLESVIKDIYDYSMSYPEPDEWLDTCLKIYETPVKDEEAGWLNYILDSVHIRCEEIYEQTRLGLDICSLPEGPDKYLKCALPESELADDLRSLKTYDELRERLIGFEFMRLPTVKDGDPVLKERFKAIRETYKKATQKLAKDVFSLTLDEQKRRIYACAPVIRELVRLTREVTAAYSELKRERKVLDFNDLEHLCIRILKAAGGDTAREYREFFEEIYVDEYQDSNLVQEELLKYITRGNNLFMVGDVKQSIYSFRLARPELFTDKYNSYETVPSGGSCNRRIDLSFNFRSRVSVLSSVNELFTQIMRREFGGIEYDDAASLHAGAKYPTTEEKQEKTELLLTAKEDGISSRELEARVIATRIKKLMDEQTVHDPTQDDPDRMRRIRYSDIVILLRSAMGWDETFKKVIEQEGIPVHTMSRTGYFEAMEVSVLLDYLRILDNPLQDIPMTAVLRSSLGGFSDEELAIMRTRFPEIYMYDSLKKYTDNKKAAVFLDRFNKMREKTGYTPVYELLLELIDGEYGNVISALPDGKRKMANLNMLLKKAGDYGKLSYKGIFHFIRYIEMLRKYEVDYGEANTPDEKDDAVRIMTIHKSKGLEFPVCFVAGIHKKYNYTDLRGSVVPDVDMGIGTDLVDPVKRIKKKTLIRTSVADKRKTELKTEEERVLYVAMTRAREKLILTGVVGDPEKALSVSKSLTNCDSYLDLIIYGLLGEGLPSVMLNTVSADYIIDSKIARTVRAQASGEEIRRVLGGDAAMTDPALADRFAFKYPYTDEKGLNEKVSVTELKRRSMHAPEPEDKEIPVMEGEVMHKEESVPFVPDFIRETDKEIPATLHGTAVHRVFEIWDYDRGTTDEDILDFLKYVKKTGLMEEELADCVSLNEIRGFVNSDLAKRMKKAHDRGLLYREQPFMFSHEDLIIQGIIDAFFVEDDRIVIVDYKTDRVDDVRELADRYRVQLEYYGKALTAMLDIPVGELIIYSTRWNRALSI